MELSKLQFPTRRRKEKEEPQAEEDSKVETVKQDEDGTIRWTFGHRHQAERDSAQGQSHG